MGGALTQSNVRPEPEDCCAAGEKGRAMVVDDDPTNVTVLTRMLERLGYGVIAVADGDGAVERFHACQPDMVLMDVMMPGMDGYEATRRIKEGAGNRFCPVLFVTAVTDEEALAACIESGGDDFVIKPYNRVILEAKISALERIKALYSLVRHKTEELEAHHEALRCEHEIAERTFSMIMQSGQLDAPNVRYLLAPMAITNGDMLLVAQRPDGAQHVLLGDFTGHGLAAAIGAIPVSDIFMSMSGKGFTIDEIVSEINKKLTGRLPPELFLAGCLLELDWNAKRVRCWNGGIPDVLVLREGAGVIHRFRSRHLPMGIAVGERFSGALESLPLETGDRILAYSDGVLEETSMQGEMFGEARLLGCCEAGGGEGVFDRICGELEAFRRGSVQSDDITLIEVRFTEGGSGMARPAGSAAPGVTGEADYEVGLEFDARAMREGDPLGMVTRVLESIDVISDHRSRIYTVVAELYSNALDHGLLGLDSALKSDPEGFDEYYRVHGERLAALSNGRIGIRLRIKGAADGGEVRIRVQDSGGGFDATGAGGALPASGDLANRGLAIVAGLCRRVSHSSQGRVVDAEYVW